MPKFSLIYTSHAAYISEIYATSSSVFCQFETPN